MKTNKLFFLLLVVLFFFTVILGYWIMSAPPEITQRTIILPTETPKCLLGDRATLQRAVHDGQKTPNAYVSIPYAYDSNDYSYINIAVDLNQDGIFAPYESNNYTQQEWVIQNMPALISQSEGISYSFMLYDLEADNKNDISLTVTLTKEKLAEWDGMVEDTLTSKKFTIASITPDEIRDRFAPDPEGVRIGSLTSNFINAALAAPAELPDRPPTAPAIFDDTQRVRIGDIFKPGEGYEHSDMPDITQGRNECALMAAANSMVWLANKYMFNDKLPVTREFRVDTQKIIDELRTDMAWDENGIDMKDFKSGKDKFNERHKISIETHRIGTEFDIDIIPKILKELMKGQDVEIEIEYGFWDARGNYSRKGGHMVTATGVYWDGEKILLSVHDPASKSEIKRDAYIVSGTRIVNYRFQGTSTSFIKSAYAESPADKPPKVLEEEPKTASATPTGQDFSHEIGATQCPTPIGEISIEGSEGLRWEIINDLPKWITVSKKSGSVPDTFKTSFSCQLDSYKTQNLKNSIEIKIIDESDDQVGNILTVDVTGKIKK